MAIDELTREFLIESQEGLDRMERCLTELEERPQDAGLIGDIFRSVHTIKGTTGFLGFKRLEKLAHAGENLLGLLREGKLTADRPTTTGLLQLMDGLRSILKSIETQDSEGEGEDTALIARLGELQLPAKVEVQHAAVKSRRAAVGRDCSAASRAACVLGGSRPLRNTSRPLQVPAAAQIPRNSSCNGTSAASGCSAGQGCSGKARQWKRNPTQASRARRPRGRRRRARCVSMWRC
jgi:two-component system chemotaxis sensor kinase CheA